jgi:hypothetical protein
VTKNVEVGISNDSYTEIISGVEEGDIVVSSQISQISASNNDVQQGGGFMTPGMGGR